MGRESVTSRESFTSPTYHYTMRGILKGNTESIVGGASGDNLVDVIGGVKGTEMIPLIPVPGHAMILRDEDTVLGEGTIGDALVGLATLLIHPLGPWGVYPGLAYLGAPTIATKGIRLENSGLGGGLGIVGPVPVGNGDGGVGLLDLPFQGHDKLPMPREENSRTMDGARMIVVNLNEPIVGRGLGGVTPTHGLLQGGEEAGALIGAHGAKLDTLLNAIRTTATTLGQSQGRKNGQEGQGGEKDRETEHSHQLGEEGGSSEC